MAKKEVKQVQGNLVYIPIDELYPHPDNPRKDLGDLSELADSIKVKGVLQNLTVVRGHAQTHEEWLEYEKQYNENPSEELREKINAKQYDDGYTVIIGHRRTEAARLAGLKELPCIIADMTPEEQVTTMMLENMQRSDLTVYEQAKGFQMMLDFGNSIETVAEKSGFSTTTVRRRVKLLELDEDKFKASESRNVSLFEYMELDKIKDVDLKNKVLDSVGTANFNNELQRAINQEETQEYIKKTEAEISKFATKAEDGTGCVWKGDYGAWNKKEVVIPDDADTVEYFYKVSGNYITLYAKKDTAEAEADEEAERIRAEQRAKEEMRRSKLEECTKRAFELRKEAIESISNTHAQKHIAEIISFMMKVAQNYYVRVDDDEILEMLKIDPSSEMFEEWDDEQINDYINGEINSQVKKAPAKMLLKFAHAFSEDTEETGYFDSWRLTYRENEKLDRIYDFLCSLGYEMSDEEKSLRDGTHELFGTEENE